MTNPFQVPESDAVDPAEGAAMLPIDFDALQRFAEGHFVLGPRSLHGPAHWERVEAFGIRLVNRTPGADLIIVRLFAWLHDVERRIESTDPLHGRRAAALVRRLAKDRLPLDDQQLGQLIYACELHADGLTSNCPTIGCCWDADRLDLPRVWIQPTRDRMSTKYGKSLAR